MQLEAKTTQLGLDGRWGLEELHGNVVNSFQVPFKALAVAAIRILKDRQLALPISSHNGKCIFEGQILKLHCAELIHPFCCQVAFGSEVDQIALKQKIGLGICVKNIASIDANFINPIDDRFVHFIDMLHLWHPL